MGREVNLSGGKLAVSASVSCMDIGHLNDVIDEVNTSDISALCQMLWRNIIEKFQAAFVRRLFRASLLRI